jgi:hypothetical protein
VLGAVDTSQGGELWAHQGLLYGSQEEFLGRCQLERWPDRVPTAT